MAEETSNQEQTFVKQYIADVLYICNISKGLTNIVYALLEHSIYTSEGLRSYIPTGLKNEIVTQLGIPRQTFNNALVKLCKENILKHIDKGVYEFNPSFFGHDAWADIHQIRMVVNYMPGVGRTVQSVIEYKQQQNSA